MVIQTIRKRYSGACWVAAATLGVGIPTYIVMNPPAPYAQEISLDEVVDPCQSIIDSIQKVDSSLEEYGEKTEIAFDEGNYMAVEDALNEILGLLERKKKLVSEHKNCSYENRQFERPFDYVLWKIEKYKVEILYMLGSINSRQWDSYKNPSDAKAALEYYNKAMELDSLLPPDAEIGLSEQKPGR